MPGLQRALDAWYLDLDTEPAPGARPDSIEEAILTSPLIGEEFYRTQSEQRMVVTDEMGDERVTTEPGTVLAHVVCVQHIKDTRPKTSCVLSN